MFRFCLVLALAFVLVAPVESCPIVGVRTLPQTAYASYPCPQSVQYAPQPPPLLLAASPCPSADLYATQAVYGASYGVGLYGAGFYNGVGLYGAGFYNGVGNYGHVHGGGHGVGHGRR